MENKEAKAAAPAAEETPKGRAPKKKKSRPTNCVQSNKRIRRKDWYYRNGKFFANKKAFATYQAAEAEKKKKAVEAAQSAEAKTS